MAKAPTSYGYPAVRDADGKILNGITSDILAVWLPAVAASRYGVVGKDDWKVTAQSGLDRGIRINAGIGFGDGILDDFPEYDTISLPLPQGTSQWFLIVARRNWTAPATTKFFVIPGTSAKAIPSTGVSKEPGQEADQHVALVRVAAGQTVVQEIVDLRGWAGNGGVEIADQLGREQLTKPGAAVKLGNQLHRYEHNPANGGSFAWKVYLAQGFIPSTMGNFFATSFSGSGEAAIAIASIPDPGVPYRVKALAGVVVFADGQAGMEIKVRLDSPTGEVHGALGARPAGTASGLGMTVAAGLGGLSGVRTGPLTVYVTARRAYGSGGWVVTAGGNSLGVDLIPA